MKILKLAMLFLTLLSVSNQQNENNDRCGQYGFRCVDSESYQICGLTDLDGMTDAPEIIRKCLDHNVCDEDNIAYCTPLDRMENIVTAKPNGKKNGFSKRSHSANFLRNTDLPLSKSNFNGLRDLSLRNSDSADPFGFNNEDDIDIETTTTATDSDDYPTFKYQKFECESFGYFAGLRKKCSKKIPQNNSELLIVSDIYNASMFWHCDHQNKGKGFIVRHMLCSPGRVFNPVHKECVMIGTTRNIRNNVGDKFVTSFHPKHTYQQNRQRIFGNIEKDLKSQKKFSCKNRIPGKYSDEANCRLYHFCLPKSFAPFNELTLLCPDRLAYDDEKQTCNRISFERCAERLYPHDNKILHIEIDAIVLQKQKCKLDLRRHNSDCSEYHLCYNDEIVHLKCPQSYRFDENLLTCQPEHLVSCEY